MSTDVSVEAAPVEAFFIISVTTGEVNAYKFSDGHILEVYLATSVKTVNSDETMKGRNAEWAVGFSNRLKS